MIKFFKLFILFVAVVLSRVACMESCVSFIKKIGGSKTTQKDLIALHNACDTGDFEGAKALIDKGVPNHCLSFGLEYTTKNYPTPLYRAYKKGYHTIVVYLLKRGAHDGEVFYQACKAGNLEIIKLLIKNGVEINAYNYKKYPLYKAYSKKHFEICDFLLKSGSKALHGFHAACLNGDLDAVKFFLSKEALLFQKSVESEHNLARGLVYAVDAGEIKVVEFLVGEGAHLEFRDSISKATPLFHACRKSYKNIVCFLLERSADINTQSGSPSWANGPQDRYEGLLHCTSSLELLKLLLEKGINLELKHGAGATALLGALWLSDFQEKALLLIEKGACINAQNDEGYTPLHAACMNHPGVAITLISMGSDLEAQTCDHEKLTPLHLASEETIVKIISWIADLAEYKMHDRLGFLCKEGTPIGNQNNQQTRLLLCCLKEFQKKHTLKVPRPVVNLIIEASLTALSELTDTIFIKIWASEHPSVTAYQIIHELLMLETQDGKKVSDKIKNKDKIVKFL